MHRNTAADTTLETCPRRGIDHGTAYGYRKGCRCPEGRHANAKRWGARLLARERGVPSRVDATGTRRRLDALRRQGWSLVVLSKMGGFDRNCYLESQVWLSTAQRVAALYDEIGERHAPESRGSKITATVAAKEGVPTRWAWGDRIDDPAAEPETGAAPGEPVVEDVDRVAIQRVLAGKAEPKTLSRTERLWCIRYFAEQGCDAGHISHVLKVNRRQVEAHLEKIARHGLVAVNRHAKRLAQVG